MKPYRKVTKTQENITQESQEVSPFPAVDFKAASNRQAIIIKTNMKHKLQKDPQKKHRLGMVSKSKKEGKDQKSIQSSTTPDPGYQW